jgi:transcriptional regulator with XRE-family HTH domain
VAKQSNTAEALPAQAREHLRVLGENLAIARKRRHESRAQWASRIGVSIPTLTRLEAGDPSVSMAAYATALWLMGRSSVLAEAADPQADRGALELELRSLGARPGTRPKTSSIAGAVNRRRQEGGE